jgi:hypothetical protein
LFSTILVACLTTTPASAQYWEFSPAYTNSAGVVYAVSVAVVSDWTVTAVCNSTSNLEVIVWSNANLSRPVNGKQVGGSCPTHEVAITALSGSTFVTVVANGQGQLELDSWTIVGQGALSYGFPATIAYSGSPSIAATSSNQVVTASVDSHDTLHVVAWSVNPQTLVIEQQGPGATASGYITQTAIANAGQGYVATASMPPGEPPQPLAITGWYVASNGVVTMEGSPVSLGMADQFAVSSYSKNGSNYVATAEITESLDLEINAWSVSSSGVADKDTGNAGQANYVAVCGPFDSVPYEGDQLSGYIFTAVSGVAGGDFNRDAELWSVGSGSITQSPYTHNGTAKISSIVAACSSTAGNDFAVTADINKDSSDLELVEWTLVYQPIIN